MSTMSFSTSQEGRDRLIVLVIDVNSMKCPMCKEKGVEFLTDLTFDTNCKLGMNQQGRQK